MENLFLRRREQYNDLKSEYSISFGSKKRIIDKFKLFFGYECTYVYKDYVRRLGETTILANFLLAIDDVCKNDQPIDDFMKRFNFHCKSEYSFMKGLKVDIMNRLPKIKWYHVKREELKGNSFFASHEYLNSSDLPVPDQEIRVDSDKIMDYLYDNFSAQVANDTIDHYIYGESFRDLSYYRKEAGCPMAAKNIYVNTKKAWEQTMEALGYE